MRGWKLAYILTPSITFAIGISIGLDEGFSFYRNHPHFSSLIILTGLQYAFMFAAASTVILTVVFLFARPSKSKKEETQIAEEQQEKQQVPATPNTTTLKPRLSKKKALILYSATGSVFLIGIGIWFWLREHSGFSFSFTTAVLSAGFIGAMVGLVNSLIKSKLS